MRVCVCESKVVVVYSGSSTSHIPAKNAGNDNESNNY